MPGPISTIYLFPVLLYFRLEQYVPNKPDNELIHE